MYEDLCKDCPYLKECTDRFLNKYIPRLLEDSGIPARLDMQAELRELGCPGMIIDDLVGCGDLEA